MSNPIPVIIFLGAPGAGKGTQALLLSQRKSIPKISTGDMLRHAVSDHTELGTKVKQIMSEGGLVDDETMLRLIKERIAQPDCLNGFILDGYPRKIHQAEQLQEVLDGGKKVYVIVISVSEEDIVKRISGRRMCLECERIYNIHSQSPKKDELCDADGSTLIRRNDDSEDVVRTRIQTFKRETLPLLDHYRTLGTVHVINGNQPKERVAELISQLI